MAPYHETQYEAKGQSGCAALAKRTIDITAACLLLLAVSPVLLLISIFIRRDGGPALFKHRRIGKDGKSFACLKFRSMAQQSDALLAAHLFADADARKEWNATRKLKSDPRVTRLGRILRSTSLDELPQLFNVLKGEMSLVGPRPIVQDEVFHYKGDIAHYYAVRPGITGLWQVSGRNDVTYEKRVELDSAYVRNWSLWSDMAILCRTVPALLQRRGAY